MGRPRPHRGETPPPPYRPQTPDSKTHRVQLLGGHSSLGCAAPLKKKRSYQPPTPYPYPPSQIPEAPTEEAQKAPSKRLPN